VKECRRLVHLGVEGRRVYWTEFEVLF
jgi:ribosomal protein L24E